jgi:hypothetical protein
VAGNITTQPKPDRQAMPMISLCILLCLWHNAIYLIDTQHNNIKGHISVSLLSNYAECNDVEYRYADCSNTIFYYPSGHYYKLFTSVIYSCQSISYDREIFITLALVRNELKLSL